MSYKSIINPDPTGDDNIPLSLYSYRPALSFNIIAAVLFGLVLSYLTFKTARYVNSRLVYFWLMFGSVSP
jgi:hypothetical protein